MSDGFTPRQHAQSAWRQTGVKPPELKTWLPDYLAYLWDYFQELRIDRDFDDNGPKRLSRAQIHAWERDRRLRLDPWERKAILGLDGAYLAAHAKARALAQPNTPTDK